MRGKREQKPLQGASFSKGQFPAAGLRDAPAPLLGGPPEPERDCGDVKRRVPGLRLLGEALPCAGWAFRVRAPGYRV